MQIICIPPNTLTPQQKGALAKKGMVIIETDDPQKVKVISPESILDSSDWFMSALYSLTCNHPSSKQEQFVNALYKRLKEKEMPADPPPDKP